MTTYCAVAKYPVEATDKERIRSLREGLEFVAIELVGLGCSLEQIEGWLEEARMAAEAEVEYAHSEQGNVGL